MSGIETTGAAGSRSFPVGYRFRPTDEELINYYLRCKNSGQDGQVKNIPVIDICKSEPWDIAEILKTDSDDDEWYFFCKRDVKYGRSGNRSHRATNSGFWKPTGNDRNIKPKKNRNIIGKKKTLVFYLGPSKNSVRTNWVSHEYRQYPENSQAFVLYLLKKKPDENPDISTPEGVEPNGSAASPVTPISNATSPNQATPANNMEPGNPWSDPLEDMEPFLSDPEIQALLFNSEDTCDGMNSIFHQMPQQPMYPNLGFSSVDTRYYNASTHNHVETRYQNGTNEWDHHVFNQNVSDEAISVLSADQPENSDTDDEVPQFLLFETRAQMLSKPVARPSISKMKRLNYKEMNLAKEPTCFEESSDDADPESEMVAPEATKKLRLHSIPQGSTGSSKEKGFFVLVENPRLKNGPSPPSVYITNMILGACLFILLSGEVLFWTSSKV